MFLFIRLYDIYNLFYRYDYEQTWQLPEALHYQTINETILMEMII